MNNDKRLEIIFNHIKNGVEFISTDNVFIEKPCVSANTR